MAYPAAPGQRMAIDRDGSTCTWWNTNTTGGPFEAQWALAIMNSEYGASQWPQTQLTANTWEPEGNVGGLTYITIIFPEFRDITGLYIDYTVQNYSITTVVFATSTDTTDGRNGTWVTQTYPPAGAGLEPGWRGNISTINPAWTGVKAVQIQGNGLAQPSGFPLMLTYWHLYGQPSSGQNPNSLRIWQTTTDAEVTGPLDFGDIAQGSLATAQFRIHNLSSSHTANGPITVSMEALSNANPSLLSQFSLSTDNVNFFSSLNLNTLPPLGYSPVIYVRDFVASNAALSAWALRIVALPSSWT
jgi:hypothetical protein